METYAVSPRVNSPARDDEQCVLERTNDEIQMTNDE